MNVKMSQRRRKTGEASPEPAGVPGSPARGPRATASMWLPGATSDGPCLAWTGDTRTHKGNPALLSDLLSAQDRFSAK